ncbi:MAG: exoribonuclease II [Candidatus Dasytiphilus stammeri]
MLKNNLLLKQLKKQLQTLSRIEGIVKQTKTGFGWLHTNTSKKYLISKFDMKRVMHGDRIIAILENNDNQPSIAKPEKLLEPAIKRFIGRIQNHNKLLSIIPYFLPIKNLILCSMPTNNIKYHFKSGDWVVAEICKHPLTNLNDQNFYADLIQIISSGTDHLVPWWVTLVKHNLERHSPVMHHNTIFIKVENEKLYREDLTKLPFITIDNDSTEDMDDALYAEEISTNLFRLTIAIADPSSLIIQNSELDLLAANRSFSTYLPNLNIPMLPRQFSEKFCSLRPGVQRPVLICQIVIKNDGSIIFSQMKFSLAWIISKAKLIYRNVSNWLENSGKWNPENKIIADQIKLLYRIYIRRYRWRKQNALVLKNQDQPQYHFVFNAAGCISDIKIEYRRIAHFLIEEIMITANICASNFLREKLGFGIYNVHIGFNKTDVQLIVNILAKYGLIFDSSVITTLNGYCHLQYLIDTLSIPYLNNIMKKFQTVTEITTQPKPHFGLGLECYATWTSPIRKYGDIINHRLIKSILIGKNICCPSPETILIMKERRRLNRLAQRDVKNWLYSLFLKKYINPPRKFRAEIKFVIQNGLCITIIDNGAQAFIPKIFIHSKYKELILNQEIGIVQIQHKELFKVGDLITVYIFDINPDSHRIIAYPINF